MYKWKSKKCGNVVTNFKEVIKQVFESLFVFHTLDLKWEYAARGWYNYRETGIPTQ